MMFTGPQEDDFLSVPWLLVAVNVSISSVLAYSRTVMDGSREPSLEFFKIWVTGI